MKVRVNEIFPSLQGEGHFSGKPAVFLRLSGCNLRCYFCDTLHETYEEMTEEEIVVEALRNPMRHIVVTGGEPALQLTATLVDKLHAAGFFVQVETNGSLPLPPGIDWVTCSPKTLPVLIPPRSPGEPLRFGMPCGAVDELKVLCKGVETDLTPYENIPAREYRLQPLDTGDKTRNRTILRQAIDLVMQHPHWSLSLQTHKLIGIR